MKGGIRNVVAPICIGLAAVFPIIAYSAFGIRNEEERFGLVLAKSHLLRRPSRVLVSPRTKAFAGT